nr:hypothetical protein [Asticcacaulis sp. YBE204]
MSDEIDTYDGLAKVSKFEGGQLTWRPWTNKVTAALTTDLQVDLPFSSGEKWRVVQANGYILDDPKTTANEGDSHQAKWVYCYDLVAVSPTVTKGAKFTASATGTIVLAIQGNANDDSVNANVVVQSLGLGRYASSLHVQQNSYSNTFGNGKPALTVATPWLDRPVAKSGDAIATVGRTGTGGEHIHYCVTTTPDNAAYAPFESVPFAFRNYEVATNDTGTTWKSVAVGRPIRGSILRKGTATPTGLPKVKLSAAKDLLHFGDVSGTVTLPAGKTLSTGKVKVTAFSSWGEPLEAVYATGTGAGPFTYKLNAPNYTNVRIEVSVVDTTDAALKALKGAKVLTIVANTNTKVDVVVK